MADISQISINDTIYDIKDAVTRAAIEGSSESDLSLYDMVEAIYNYNGLNGDYTPDLIRYDVPIVVTTSESEATADLSFIPDYDKLTIDNMDIGFSNVAYGRTYTSTFEFTYDNSTGILTVTASSTFFFKSTSSSATLYNNNGNQLTIFINSNLQRYIPTSYSYTSMTFDMSSIDGYENKVAGSFVPLIDAIYSTSTNWHPIIRTYDSSTGILTVSSSENVFHANFETLGIKIAIY